MSRRTPHRYSTALRQGLGVRAAQRGARVAVLALLMLTSACSADLPPNYWREEVQLADGSRGVIEQRRKWRGLQEIGGPGALFIDLAEISGEIGGETLPTWSMPTWEPLLLERDPETREWVLVVTSGNPRVMLPNPGPYKAFRHRSGTWSEETVPEFAWGMKSNLLVPAHMISKRGDLVTLEQKKLWHSTRMPGRVFAGIYKDANLYVP